jgi:hypothetical protein
MLEKILKWGCTDRKLYDCEGVLESVVFKDGVTGAPVRFFYSKGKDEGREEKEQEDAAKALALDFVARRGSGKLETSEGFGGLEHFVTKPQIARLLVWAEKELSRRSRQEASKKKRTPNEAKRLESLRRAKARIRRLANTNKFCVMWTLTFSVKRQKWQEARDVISPENQRDCRKVSKIWNTFLTRFRYYYGEQAFIKVLERHRGEETTDEKIDTFHIHIACSFLCDKYTLQAVWGHGNVWYDDFRKERQTKQGKGVKKEKTGKVQNPGRYISKYIEKDFGTLPYGMRNFTCSRGIKKYKIMRDEEGCKQKVEDALKKDYRKTYSADMMIDVKGKELKVSVSHLEKDRNGQHAPRMLKPLKGVMTTAMRNKAKAVRKASTNGTAPRLHDV